MQDKTSGVSFYIFTLLIFSFAVSLFAPKTYIEISNKFTVSYYNDIIQTGSVSNLHPSNGFVSHEIFFERDNISKPLHTSIAYSTTVELKDSHQKSVKTSFSGKIYPVTPNRQSQVTGSYRLFYDSSIDYEKSSIQVNFPALPDNIKSLTLIGICGNPQYNQFLLFTRFIFAVLSIYEIFCIYRAKKGKETIHIIYFWFLFFSVDPFMILHFYSPTKIVVFLDYLAQALFSAFARYYLIFLLSTFRESTTSGLPTVFFFVIYVFSKICHNLSSSLKDIDFFTAVSTQSLPFLTFELGLEMTYITWLIVALGSSYSKAKTPYERTVIKPIYSILFILASIYSFKLLANNLVYNYSDPINSDFLNFIMFYSVSYLIGFIGSRDFAELKASKFIYDNETPEPLPAVFE